MCEFLINPPARGAHLCRRSSASCQHLPHPASSSWQLHELQLPKDGSPGPGSGSAHPSVPRWSILTFRTPELADQICLLPQTVSPQGEGSGSDSSLHSHAQHRAWHRVSKRESLRKKRREGRGREEFQSPCSFLCPTASFDRVKVRRQGPQVVHQI